MTRRSFLANGAGTVTLLTSGLPATAQTALPTEPRASAQDASATALAAIPEFDADLAYTADAERLKVRFRRWQVESLLNQSADLLDRCLRERSERDELAAKSRLLELEKQSEESDLDLRAARIKAREFDIPKEIHGLELDLEKATLQPTTPGNNEKSTKWEDVVMQYNSAINFPITGPGTPASTIDMANQDKISLGAQRIITNISKLQASTNMQSKTLQMEWDVKLKEFEKQRYDKQRSIRNEKNDSMINGKALDFGTRFSKIDLRLKADLMDAIDRASVAARGLEDFFAFEKESGGKQAPTTARLDDWALWVRSAVRWFLAFGHRDQAFSKIISLRSLKEEAVWKNAFKERKGNQITFEFSLNVSDFPFYRFVRMRGLSCFLIGDSARFDRYSATVTPPRRAEALQVRKGKVEWHQIDQDDIPVTMLGRIESRQSPRSPETSGLVSLINVSPIGDPKSAAADACWRIQLQPATTRSGNLNKLEDLELELNLVGQPESLPESSYL